MDDISQIGQQICEALGINASAVTAIDIAIRPEKPAIVSVVFHVLPNSGGELVETLKRYTLVESDE